MPQGDMTEVGEKGITVGSYLKTARCAVTNIIVAQWRTARPYFPGEGCLRACRLVSIDHGPTNNPSDRHAGLSSTTSSPPSIPTLLVTSSVRN